MTKISILGCGWLGLPLAKVLLQNGFGVKGSTTSTEKLTYLKQSGIEPFLISLSEKETIGAFSEFILDSEILIINIPPKLRSPEKENFVAKIRHTIPFIEQSTIKNVLFISSTSVYNDAVQLVYHDTPPNPDTESGKQLLETEQLLQNNTHFKTTILRFGGLIGQDRHPVKFLAGRDNLDHPEAPINLIHQNDCIGIILQIIATASWNETFNAVTPFHPSRKKYYTQKAIDMNLPLPQFTFESDAGGKIILSDYLETILKYTFTQPKL